MPASPRNRSVRLTPAEAAGYRRALLAPAAPLGLAECRDRVLRGDLRQVLPLLPDGIADLLFLDPPYNLDKDFGSHRHRRTGEAEYADYLRSWLLLALPKLKPTATVYCCGDWRSSGAIAAVCGEHLRVRNRITWEREKGRGARANWKNAAEDIWFCTVGEEYHFDLEAVKLRRRVRAPYREGGRPKDWEQTAAGNFRLTHPSNLWTDLSVPFWSMPENTAHPTQKPEKLLARLILASCPPGGLVLDPFLGSGTSAVAARKLGRHFLGIELDEQYCCLALKRLDLAAADPCIQGYADGVFWERNSAPPRQG